MKPVYYAKENVPQEVLDKTRAETPEGASEEQRAKAIEKLYAREVFLEQELATSEEPIKIREFLAQQETTLGKKVSLKEWALFNIGG